jgi:hypothetical protein
MYFGRAQAAGPEALRVAWQAARQCLNRASPKGRYVRIDTPGPGFRLFSTAPWNDAEGMAPEDAIRRLGEVLRSLTPRHDGSRGKSYGSWSQRWKPPRPKSIPSANWSRVGSTSVCRGCTVADFLRGKGVQFSGGADVGGDELLWKVTWDCPADMPELERAGLVYDLETRLWDLPRQPTDGPPLPEGEVPF